MAYTPPPPQSVKKEKNQRIEPPLPDPYSEHLAHRVDILPQSTVYLQFSRELGVESRIPRMGMLFMLYTKSDACV